MSRVWLICKCGFRTLGCLDLVNCDFTKGKKYKAIRKGEIIRTFADNSNIAEFDINLPRDRALLKENFIIL